MPSAVCISLLNKCINSTCIYHSPGLCGTLSWSCDEFDSWVIFTLSVPRQQFRSPGLKFGNACVRPGGPNTIKTPNPKCRHYWRLIELIDRRYSQSCWYFRLLLWTRAPLTFSLVHLPPPPFPCINNYRGMYSKTIHTVCNGGGRGSGASDRSTHAAQYLLWSILKKADI